MCTRSNRSLMELCLHNDFGLTRACCYPFVDLFSLGESWAWANSHLPCSCNVFRKLTAPKGHTWQCFRLRTRDSLEGFICPLICPSIRYTFLWSRVHATLQLALSIDQSVFRSPLTLKSLCSYKKQGRIHSPSRGRVGRSGIARKCSDFVLVTHRPRDWPTDQPTDIASQSRKSATKKKWSTFPSVYQ